MANVKVTLIINCKTDKGWRRYPVALGKNGRARSGVAVVNGEPVAFENFRYELRSYERSKVVYKTASSKVAQEALNEAEKQHHVKQSIVTARAAGVAVSVSEDRLALRPAIQKYVQRANDNQAHEAAVVYSQALKDFTASNSIAYVDEVNEDVMRKFHGYLRSRGNGPRTVANKHTHVKGFFMWAGVDSKKLGPKPKFEKKIPVVYEPDTVRKLIDAIKTPYFRVVVDVLRMAGLRDQEARHLTWADIDFRRGLILVRSKPELGFRIKDKEERDVPLVPALAETLRQWKDNQNPHSALVLATSKGKVNTKWLLALKNVARRAGLNCGSCVGCRKKGRVSMQNGKRVTVSGNECRKFTLHAFRRTYATMLSRNGIDVRTIMNLLGHSEIATTLAYLAPMTTESAQLLCNAIKW